ncbi:cupin domain-containing protein [Caulobacter soli]|uniref:cupin domain-containing protein n=1 Tax=Caulobacter soli TaxID=2708539 RepID=UPI0013EAE4FA|nr:cupin domain-containing protein [Caulobacter soli]
MLEDRFCSFRETDVETRTSPPPVWTVLSGQPQAQSKRSYSDEEKKIYAGTFKCTAGVYAINYDVWEFCHLIKGKCLITHESGRQYELNAGDAFVLEPGFKGTWAIVEDMEKSFVMHAG